MITEAGLQERWVIVCFRESTEVKKMRLRKGYSIRANYLVQYYIHRLCVLKKNLWSVNMSVSNTHSVKQNKIDFFTLNLLIVFNILICNVNLQNKYLLSFSNLHD